MTSRLLFLVFLLTFSAYGQGWIPSGARSMSMANASAAEVDVWSFFNNPAALSRIETFACGISYENRFLLKELQSQGLVFAIPLKTGVLSVGGHQYGYRNLRSIKAGVGYSMNLAKNLSAGVQLNYQSLLLNENYGSTQDLTAEIGLFYQVSEEWSFGFSAFNVNRARLTTNPTDRYSSLFRLASAYQFSKRVRAAAEVEKEMEHQARLKIGLEYEAIDNLYLRCGFATSRPEFTFGFGYRFKAVSIDLGSAYDQILGWSPHFSFQYKLPEKPLKSSGE